MAEVPTTWHAPSARSAPEVLTLQMAAFCDDPAFSELLHCVPDGVLVLNQYRQIIYANKAAMDLVRASSLEDLAGLRPGEYIGCVHALDCEVGCGTSQFCRYCGAVNAILQARPGRQAVEECHLLVRRAGGDEALDLRVWATAVSFGAFPCTFFAFVDIADEKRKLFLERLFLHDIGNTASAMKGFLALLCVSSQHTGQRERYMQRLDFLSDQILDEIHAHRVLMAAESGDLKCNPRPLSTLEVLREVLEAYDRPALLDGRSLLLDPDAADVAFESDPVLLGRVLGNMVKNAIEASVPGEAVRLGCGLERGMAGFQVRNATHMPEKIRLQVFNRSFSTKGAGRGLGTYSMKFLTERYLGGEIGFTSTEAEGTCFNVRYPLVFRA